ncbi:hypothetical protein BGZ97_003420 [Linnemannia gamsii]|uniref:Uncharacterized protein n=1 Tax=Linnemannia gamsii TaxID=64522 RepID=A0A9P6QTC5_9FUNG|nr:hypothetical protein BGZ97_003420 [Linnemannia gamsii]
MLVSPLPSPVPHRSIPTSFSSSPPASSSALSEHKPLPAAQSKVHDLARRFSAISKQSTAENATLGVPQTHQRNAKGGSFGRTEGSKISSLLNKFAEPKTTSITAATIADKSGGGARANDDATNNQQQQQQQQHQQGGETIQAETVHGVVDKGDVEKEIESNLNVKDLSLIDKVLDMDLDLVDVPLSSSNNNNSNIDVNDLGDEPDKTTEEESANEEEAKPAGQEHNQEKEKEQEVPGLQNDDDVGIEGTR